MRSHISRTTPPPLQQSISASGIPLIPLLRRSVFIVISKDLAADISQEYKGLSDAQKLSRDTAGESENTAPVKKEKPKGRKGKSTDST